MTDMYAQDFMGIPDAIGQNDALRQRIIALIAVQPMPGKVTEGGDRLQRFRAILVDLVNAQITLSQAIRRTAIDIPRDTSLHGANNRVFAHDWDERLVRTQLSRFYNQAVMEKLLEDGETMCRVPHSSAERSDSNCSNMLAGRKHDLQRMYDLLISSYAHGNWSTTTKIPDHPHCTHVIAPIQV
jgi:hypothetical protein